MSELLQITLSCVYQVLRTFVHILVIRKYLLLVFIADFYYDLLFVCFHIWWNIRHSICLLGGVTFYHLRISRSLVQDWRYVLWHLCFVIYTYVIFMVIEILKLIQWFYFRHFQVLDVVIGHFCLYLLSAIWAYFRRTMVNGACLSCVPVSTIVVVQSQNLTYLSAFDLPGSLIFLCFLQVEI